MKFQNRGPKNEQKIHFFLVDFGSAFDVNLSLDCSCQICSVVFNLTLEYVL